MLHAIEGKKRIALTEHYHINKVIGLKCLYDLGYIKTRDNEIFITKRGAKNFINWPGEKPSNKIINEVREWVRNYEKTCEGKPKKQKKVKKTDSSATQLTLDLNKTEESNLKILAESVNEPSPTIEKLSSIDFESLPTHKKVCVVLVII